MSLILFLLIVLFAAVIGVSFYVSSKFDDPTVPLVEDIFPPRAERPYTLLEIWAHPDDETMAGGVTAKYGRHQQVRVVACYFTAGDAGKPGVPPVCKQEELALVRRGEMAVAATTGHMDTHEIGDFNDGTLHEVKFEKLEEQAVRWIRRYRPTILVTWDPSGGSGHRDHIRCNEVVRAAFHSAADPKKYPQQIEKDGLAAHQALRLYEVVVPGRLTPRWRRAQRGNASALDQRLQPTHAVDVRGFTMDRYRMARAHRTQAFSLGPLVRWYGPFFFYCWQKEYLALTRSAEPAA